MRAGSHAAGRILGCEARAHREATTDALGDRYDIRCDSRPFVGEELAVAPDAAIGPRPGRRGIPFASQSSRNLRMRDGATGRKPPSPWTGSIRMPAVSGPIAGSSAAQSSKGTWVEAFNLGAESFKILGLPPAAIVASVRPWKAPSKLQAGSAPAEPFAA